MPIRSDQVVWLLVIELNHPNYPNPKTPFLYRDGARSPQTRADDDVTDPSYGVARRAPFSVKFNYIKESPKLFYNNFFKLSFVTI